MDLPRQRRTTSRYGKQDNVVNMSDLDSSDHSDSDADKNPEEEDDDDDADSYHDELKRYGFCYFVSLKRFISHHQRMR